MSFDYLPTLASDLVKLRPLQPNDFDALYRVASDPLIWEQHPCHDRYTPTKFRVFFDEAISSNGALVIIETETNEIIGSTRFHGYSQHNSEVEIGWSFLARKYWGGKYNRQTKSMMLNYAFQSVDSVVFLIGSDNQRSRKAVEKIGGVCAGERADDSGISNVVYKINKM